MKAPLSPLGGGLYLFSETPGGLLEKGGLVTKLNDKDISDNFLVFALHILQIQHSILRVKYTTSAQFLFQTISELTS